MEVLEILENLRGAAGGSRVLDRYIAEAIGWRRVVREDRGDAGQVITRGVWYPPNSETSGTIPNYTSDLEAAHSLVLTIAPQSIGGCSWEDGAATARVDNGPYIQASTPSLAMTCAALRLLRAPHI